MGIKAKAKKVLKEIDPRRAINEQDSKGHTKLHRVILAEGKSEEKKLAEITSLMTHEEINLDIQDHESKTPLLCAVEKRYKDIVVLLLEKGADPNIPQKNKKMPLLCAISKGYSDIIKELLLKNRLHLDIEEKSATDLFFRLIMENRSDIVKLLLDNGISPNVSPQRDTTLLHRAVQYTCVSIVRLFLAYGLGIGAQEAQAPLLDKFIITQNISLRTLLLLAGLNTYSDKNEQVCASTKIIRAKLEQKVREIAEDMRVEEMPEFLRLLPYLLKIHAILNHPTLDEAFKRGLALHIIEYRYDELLTKDIWSQLVKAAVQYLPKRSKQEFFNDNQAPLVVKEILENSQHTPSLKLLRQVLRHFTNVFRALARESRLPPELMNHILDEILESETLANEVGISLKEMLPYYLYVKANPEKWAEFNEKRFTEEFIEIIQENVSEFSDRIEGFYSNPAP